MTALLTGRPVVDGSCVKVEVADPRGDRITVLWHLETEMEKRGGELFLRNSLTGDVYPFGEELRIGGGQMPAAYVTREHPDVAERCGPPYWSGYLPSPLKARAAPVHLPEER